MCNLLLETLDELNQYKKKPSDVLWIGTRDGKKAMSWEEFANKADFEYDDGYGGVEINLNLVVVGDGWWLERHEYDGAEGWSYKTVPVKRVNSTGLRSLREK
jgi:hypothetical protein